MSDTSHFPQETAHAIRFSQNPTSPLSNKLFAALPRADAKSLSEHFAIVPMARGTLLFDVNNKVDHIFFPLSGTVSLRVVLKDGKAIETATVGRKGVVGAMAGLGLYKSHVRAVIQIASVVARISAREFRKLAASTPAISDMCIGYNEVSLAHARVTAACNLSHSIEARFCRALLETRDHIESDTIPLTQEFLSEMLCVQRTSVSEIASKVLDKGAISYSRGVIKIVNLHKLKEISCECYETLLSEMR